MHFLFANFSHGKLLALLFFVTAAITDAYDGKLARKYDTITKFGIFLDPLADKFLVLSAFYGFMFLPVLSTTVKLWMIILISFRDILVTLLRTVMEYKGITMITSKLAKIKTFLQKSAVLARTCRIIPYSVTFLNGWTLVGIAGILGAINFMFQPIHNSLLADVTHGDQRGIVYGFSAGISFGVGSLAGIIGGYIGDIFSIN